MSETTTRTLRRRRRARRAGIRRLPSGPSCETCAGLGYVYAPDPGGWSFDCPDCRGTGRLEPGREQRRPGASAPADAGALRPPGKQPSPR